MNIDCFLGPTILVLIKCLLNFTVFFRGTIFQSVRYRQKWKYRMWRTNGWTPDVDKGHACAKIEVPVWCIRCRRYDFRFLVTMLVYYVFVKNGCRFFTRFYISTRLATLPFQIVFFYLSKYYFIFKTKKTIFRITTILLLFLLVKLI